MRKTWSENHLKSQSIRRMTFWHRTNKQKTINITREKKETIYTTFDERIKFKTINITIRRMQFFKSFLPVIN